MTIATPPAVATTRPSSTGSNILIVDDRSENLLALEAALAPLARSMIRASSGEEALRCLLKNDIAVIILDVQMPGLDGFETANYIKQLDRTKHIPIIFLTAINKDAAHVFQGYSVGAVDYLFKPFDANVLRSKVAVFIDLHEKKLELKASEERFRRTFDHAPIGVALVAMSGAMLKVNRALSALTGFSQAELVTKKLHELIHPDEEPIDLDELLGEVPGAGGSWHVERRLTTRSGVERHALVAVSYIPGAAALEPHFIFQITDITERREIEAFRERFVSHAAHELRTPATVISGTASLLHDNRAEMKPEDIDQCVTALFRQSQRLTSMVANLLDLARLKEGRTVAQPSEVALHEVVQQVVESTPCPDEKSVNTSIDPGLVALVDPEGIEHILSNLLINAFRYGGNRIDLDGHRDNGHVVVCVRDDGDGVSADLAPKLFEPFTRGKAASRVGGSGLGLALVKSLVEASGGEVFYEPGDDGGACFKIRLEAP